jgi:hypothetical protein
MPRLAQLEKAMLAYLNKRNHNPKTFVWAPDADLILSKDFVNEFLTQDARA